MKESLLKKPKVLAHFWDERECIAYINESKDKDIEGRDVQDVFIETAMEYLEYMCSYRNGLSLYTKSYVRDTDTKGELEFFIDIDSHEDMFAHGGYLEKYKKITDFIKGLNKVFDKLWNDKKTVVMFYGYIFRYEPDEFSDNKRDEEGHCVIVDDLDDLDDSLIIDNHNY